MFQLKLIFLVYGLHRMANPTIEKGNTLPLQLAFNSQEMEGVVKMQLHKFVSNLGIFFN